MAKWQCEHCGKIFQFKKGAELHEKSCNNYDFNKNIKPQEFQKLTIPWNQLSEKNQEIFSTLIFIIIISIFISPIYLYFLHSDMQFPIIASLGNPRPLYFYDVDSSCNDNLNLKSSLDHISKNTYVQFVRLGYPFALLVGGISYTCNEPFKNNDGIIFSGRSTIAESESGMWGISAIIVIWNKIRLSTASNENTIIHETLHSMGFYHNSNSKSIMYPYDNDSTLDYNLKEFIKVAYVINPLAYLNIIPFNLILILFLIFGEY
ncbi:MAG: hypothetical protein WC471_00450 [Candidatus Woesearchaeota archaeon]